MTGWLCVLGWQAGICGQSFTVALQVQGLIVLNKSTYIPQAWHSVLLTIAVVSVAVIFNTFLARKLPLLEGLVLVLHVFGFFGKHESSTQVLLTRISDFDTLVGLCAAVSKQRSMDALFSRERLAKCGRCLPCGPHDSNIRTDRTRLSRAYVSVSPILKFITQLTNPSGGGSGCITHLTMGHGLHSHPQRDHWLHHGCHFRILFGTIEGRRQTTVLLRLHWHFLQCHRITCWSLGHDVHYHIVDTL